MSQATKIVVGTIALALVIGVAIAVGLALS